MIDLKIVKTVHKNDTVLLGRKHYSLAAILVERTHLRHDRSARALRNYGCAPFASVLTFSSSRDKSKPSRSFDRAASIQEIFTHLWQIFRTRRTTLTTVPHLLPHTDITTLRFFKMATHRRRVETRCGWAVKSRRCNRTDHRRYAAANDTITRQHSNHLYILASRFLPSTTEFPNSLRTEEMSRKNISFSYFSTNIIRRMYTDTV